MPDLTNEEKIDIMRMAVAADWGTDPKSDDTPITLYHAMIQAITGKTISPSVTIDYNGTGNERPMPV